MAHKKRKGPKPRPVESVKSASLHVAVTQADKQRAVSAAAYEGMSESDLVRKAVFDFVAVVEEKREAKNAE